MKILGTITFILMVSAAFGQKKYTIEGRVDPIAPNAAVELVHINCRFTILDLRLSLQNPSDVLV